MSGFIDRSAFTLQTGDTPSIRWEVSQIVSRVQPSRLILVQPMEVSRGHRLDADRYRRFVANNGDLFPRSLPCAPPRGTRLATYPQLSRPILPYDPQFASASVVFNPGHTGHYLPCTSCARFGSR